MKYLHGLFYCSFFLLGIYVAVVPILMEQQNQDVVAANTVNFTAITFKFLAAMQPDRACLYHKALE